MHYKNGREAKVGDKVIYPKYVGHTADGKPKLIPAHGIVIHTHAGATTCNAQVVPSDVPSQMVTLGHCLHEDDVSSAESEQDTVIGKPSAPEPDPNAPTGDVGVPTVNGEPGHVGQA